MHIYVLLFMCIYREGLPTEAAASTQGAVDEEDYKLYCHCNRVSFGKMVMCDNPKVSNFSCITMA